jgi:hypothetical protein
MRSPLIAAVLFLAIPVAAQADDVCQAATARALDAATAATATLVTATRYITTHDDVCDGTALALEQQDGAAVDHAWSEAINAQSVCGADDNARVQVGKLIVALHKRRLKISSQIDAINRKCN